MKKSNSVPTPGQKAQFAVFKDGSLTREQIAEWLQKDIQGIYVLLAEILGTPEVLDALVNVMYTRYVAHHESEKQQPGLSFDRVPEPLDPNDVTISYKTNPH